MAVEKGRERSRAEYSALNASAAMVSQGVNILLSYISRMIFTRSLSRGYVGVSGLFSNLLGILSLSELGIGEAMHFALYRPVAEGDIPKQQALMQLFRRMYLVVASVIGVAGLCLMPFIESMTSDTAGVENLPLLYLLYLGNSVVSYLMAYKWAMLHAHQKSYISSLYSMAFFILQTAIQIVILLTTADYILYLAAHILCTLLCNLATCRHAERLYPFLREKGAPALNREEKKGILHNIRALSLHKLGSVIINYTDSLLLSLYAGLGTVGVYSIYYFIINALKQVMNRMVRGIGASVGNLGASQDKGLLEPVFQTVFFICQGMYGLAAICLYELLPPFVELSFGPQYLFDNAAVLVLCLQFLYSGLRCSIGTFWYALGMFQRDQYKALAEAGLNLIFSILLGRRYGAIGVFWGTILGALFTSFWLDPYLFFRYCLKKSVWGFYLKYAGYLAAIVCAWLLVYWLCALVSGPLMWILFCRLVICLLAGGGLLLAIHFRSPEFKSAVGLAQSLVKGLAAQYLHRQ